jgi:GTP-binding protein
MLIHVVDASCIEGGDIIEGYEAIRNELAGYSEELLERPEIVAANKMDQEGACENAEKLRKYLEPKGIELFEICAAIGEGTNELLKRAAEILIELPIPEPIDEDGVIEEWELEREDKKFEIIFEDGAFFVEGVIVKEIMAKTNPDDPDSMRHFQKLLKDYGIIKALRRKGAKTGDIVCLEGLEFDYVE